MVDFLRLTFVRHGDYSGSSDEAILSKTGQEQTVQLINEMGERGLFDDSRISVVSSPIVRAAQTAKIIADALFVQVQQDENLSISGHVTNKGDKAIISDVTAYQKQFLAATGAAGDATHLIVVSHSPNILGLTAYLKRAVERNFSFNVGYSGAVSFNMAVNNWKEVENLAPDKGEADYFKYSERLWVVDRLPEMK